VDSATGMRLATDAVKNELDGLLNAGRQACGSLQIAGSSDLSAIGLTKKLMFVPGLVADWMQSSARGGARTALTLAKAHYPELDLDLITPTSQKVVKIEHRWTKPLSSRACWGTISSVP
jgi:hypothetical protein